jgi:RNA polymerase sigma-70 factor (ECF subfamily)
LPEKKDILDQSISGDRMAQKALYQQYKNKMFVLCLRYANCREDAEDILQEGFVKVFRDLHQYKGVGNLEGWIRKVILNVALQYIRKQQQLKTQLTSNFEQWENRLTLDAEEEQFDKELVKKILHLMQRMPVGFRTVLNLYVMEEYSHQQIADELGISVGTSKSQLNRAKAYLRELVEKTINS